MEQYIKKSTLVAEIEDKISKYTKRGEESDAKRDGYGMFWGGVLPCLNEIRTLCDTLEVKELAPIAYVVTRCEEHSDYVEEVFFDEDKAQAYCDQFKGNEYEYARYITKVKVTL